MVLNLNKAYLKALIIFSCFTYAFLTSSKVHADDECGGGDTGNAANSYIVSTWPGYITVFMGFVSAEDYAAGNVPDTTEGFTSPYTSSAQYRDPITGQYYVSHGHWQRDVNAGTKTVQYYIVLPEGVACEVPDSDSDNIPDRYDLTPNDSTPYSAAIISVCYDENNNIVAGVIQDDSGNQYMFGELPEDMEGYTIESVSGSAINYQTGESLASDLGNLNIEDFELTPISPSHIDIQPDGSIVPGNTGPLSNWKSAEEDQMDIPWPDDLEDAPSNLPTVNDTDSKHLENVVRNTNATNTNLENLAKYLGISNELLAKINSKVKSDSALSDDGSLTSEDIGDAVKDSLIDPSETIDTSTTDSIDALDETTVLTEISTKYSNRYTLFIDTIKGSDLFSLPFSIFDGPSGTGSSVQSVSIGKWGSSSDQTATIDYSDYDAAWETLRAVLLLLTSFACFKILVLKKA